MCRFLAGAAAVLLPLCAGCGSEGSRTVEYVSASGEVMAVVFDADAMNAEVHMPDGRVFHLRHIPTENDTWYGADGVELILTGSNAYVKVDGRGVGAFSR